MQAPLPINELDRLDDLYKYQILDTEPEQLLDDLSRLAAHICQTPIALITLLDKERQWFKARVGVDITETSRNVSFCNYTILQTDVLVVPNLLLDERFNSNPLVTSEHHIRFYAGCPLITARGHALGSICVVDREPRELTTQQIDALRTLGRQVVSQLEMRCNIAAINRLTVKRKQVEFETRKALTQEKELNELKSCFVNMVSHEFRTPLTTILASAESLECYSHKWSNEKKLTYLHNIQSAVHHLHELVDGVLILGCAEAGKLQFKPTSIDLEEFCRKLTEDMQLSIGTNHQLSFTIQGKCTQAYMDERLLKHIFINLLSNAIKYSPSGSQVDLRLFCKQDKVIFQVQDAGIGIPLADQEHLFESFHRASNVGNISGTGLGLSIVKRSVELHAGTISVNSTVESGTTFTVILPVKK